MKTWSDYSEKFTIKIFLDTNLLSYLTDETYKSLTTFIKLAQDSALHELVSSRFVLFEFIGIRKKEHYLRKVAANSPKSSKGEINFSSLTNQRYITKFAAPEAEFSNVRQDISNDVNEEIEKIVTEFNINFENNIVFDKQLRPVFDLCLASKISNSDCWVLVSAIFPQEGHSAENVFILTNDEDFVTFYNESSLEDVIKANSLHQPLLRQISGDDAIMGNNCSLKKEQTDEFLKESFINKTLEIIKERNPQCFLGKTFVPNDEMKDCICFKVEHNLLLPNNCYVVIIEKDLGFIYTIKRKIDYFWSNGQKVTENFVLPVLPNNQKNNISFKVLDIDQNNEEAEIPKEIFDALNKEGNYVFVHPDS